MYLYGPFKGLSIWALFKPIDMGLFQAFLIGYIEDYLYSPFSGISTYMGLFQAYLLYLDLFQHMYMYT